jgi:hypothetical protein
VVEEQRPDQTAQFTRFLPLLHRFLVVVKALGEIDGALIEGNIVGSIDVPGLLELISEQPLKLFGLTARLVELRPWHQQHEEGGVLHQDVGPEQVIGHGVRDGIDGLRHIGRLFVGPDELGQLRPWGYRCGLGLTFVLDDCGGRRYGGIDPGGGRAATEEGDTHNSCAACLEQFATAEREIGKA